MHVLAAFMVRLYNKLVKGKKSGVYAPALVFLAVAKNYDRVKICFITVSVCLKLQKNIELTVTNESKRQFQYFVT
ncbi:hypothetical protein DF182_24995 [Chitinophaga flava]|uniref:Uncharacterized protein n=1 Tax=Chitinophaga flava TaxID=2259036 RepID=A0A365XTS1_9BACT|nr:hypothetical protein DF182_24995 [Chitinophaga flava]